MLTTFTMPIALTFGSLHVPSIRHRSRLLAAIEPSPQLQQCLSDRANMVYLALASYSYIAPSLVRGYI